MPSINLKAKFAVTTGVLILAVATIITTFLTRLQERTIHTELQHRAEALTENLAYNCQLPLVTENEISLRRLALGLLKEDEVAYVQFQNAAGTTLVHVGAVSADSLQLDIPSIPSTRSGGGAAAVTRSRWIRVGGDTRYLDVVAPVILPPASGEGDILATKRQTEDDELLGHVRLGMTTLSAQQRIATIAKQANFLGVLIAVAGSVLAAVVIHFMTRPLARLMEGNRRMARGDFSLRLKVGSSDEFGQLSRSWNQMADEIQHSRELAGRYLESLRRNGEELEEANRALQLNNAEIAKVSRLKSEFLAVMSHELRTPLNGIIGFSEVLLDQKFGKLNDKQRRFSENTLSCGRHLLTLINDILDLSKVEAGRVPVSPESFDLRRSFEEIQSLVRSLAAKKGVELHCQETPEITANTDPKLFRQVMFNLLSNAIKFTPKGGTVDVSVRRLTGDVLRGEPISRAMRPGGRDAVPDEALLLVEVQDTGVGIAPDDYDKLFIAFQQLDTSYARRQEGTGLGLALTRKIVRLLRGDIWFTSRQGEGSRFMFYVPLQFPADDIEEEQRQEPQDITPDDWQVAPAGAPSTPTEDRASESDELIGEEWPWGDDVIATVDADEDSSGATAAADEVHTDATKSATPVAAGPGES